MKRRLLLSAALLIAGYSVLVAISGAPLRVHVAHAITWLPTIFFACTVYWCKSLTRSKKFAYMFLIVGLGTMMTNYATTLVALKFEATFASFIGIFVFFALVAAILIALSNWVFRKIGKRAGQTEES